MLKMDIVGGRGKTNYITIEIGCLKDVRNLYKVICRVKDVKTNIIKVLLLPFFHKTIRNHPMNLR